MPRGTKPGAARGTFKDPRYLAGAAQRLRELRARSGLTQKQVADAVGIRVRAVYEWEHGVRLPLAVLPEIAELFQTSAAFILHGVEPASDELAALRREIAALREYVTERFAQVDDQAARESGALTALHSDLADVAESIDRVLGLLVEAAEQDPPNPGHPGNPGHYPGNPGDDNGDGDGSHSPPGDYERQEGAPAPAPVPARRRSR